MSTKEYWKPTERQTEKTSIFSLMKACGDFSSYSEFHKWSVENFEKFWATLLWESNIEFVGTPETVFVPNPSGDFYGGTWFPDLQINYAQNLISNAPEQAILGFLENGKKIEYSKKRLREEVKALQTHFVSIGVTKGDRIAGYVANVPQAIVAMLAATSLGAVWSSCSPDFGHQGVLDRFGQIEPKVLFVVDGYFYNGKTIEMKEKNAALAKELPSLVDTIEISLLGESSSYEKIVTENKSNEPIEYELCAFSDPLFIMYSSGTTGMPKSIVHSIGGTLLQHFKEHKFHCDLKPDEKILYYSTCGWMMWNWLVSALQCSATVVCFDGSPMFPNMDSLWQLVKEQKIDVFGTSAKFIGACRTKNLDLAALNISNNTRLVLSTGSPLLPEDFDYFYSSVDADHKIQLASICGGTDIISCFMLGNPMLPVRRGQIQSAGLGMDVAAFSDTGERLFGESGELVCAKPFPSMPIYFLNDPENKRFKAAYFEEFEGVWHHGDYISIEDGGGVVVYGRSDATLNPGGVRIGSAEIYRIVEANEKVADSLVIGRKTPSGDDEEVVLFVKMQEGHDLDEGLVQDLKSSIKAKASPRHMPREVFQVADIPYTISGKKVEIAVKKIFAGVEPKNVDALANPTSLDIYRKLASC